MPEMPGAFGLAECFRGDQVDTSALVESHPVLDVHVLHREGLLVHGTEAQMTDGGHFRTIAHGGKIEINGQQICVGWHRSLLLRCFICPVCGSDCYKLHEVGGRWACRNCHRLKYSSRSRGRTIPKLHRIKFLRRRIGADLTPFTPLPPSPLHARKHLRIAQEIRKLERRFLSTLAARSVRC